MQINNANTSDPIQITNELKQAFCTKEMLTPPPPDNSFSDAINYQSIDNKEIHDVNLPFSISELRLALALSHESSLGFDNFNYSILHKLPFESLNSMLDIINNI